MPDIQEMTGQDLNRLNDLNMKRTPHARHRTSGWKARIGGEWHYGFLTEEDAEEALRPAVHLPVTKRT